MYIWIYIQIYIYVYIYINRSYKELRKFHQLQQDMRSYKFEKDGDSTEDMGRDDNDKKVYMNIYINIYICIYIYIYIYTFVQVKAVGGRGAELEADDSVVSESLDLSENRYVGYTSVIIYLHVDICISEYVYIHSCVYL
jgi:hypothetical protein